MWNKLGMYFSDAETMDIIVGVVTMTTTVVPPVELNNLYGFLVEVIMATTPGSQSKYNR